MYTFEKNLHILSVFKPFSFPQKEYKRILEWKIFKENPNYQDILT